MFQPLPTLVGPGECGAVDAVHLDAVILPDQSRVVVTPAGVLRCPMAEELARWVRDDVAPTATKLGSPLRVLDNFDSYECRGRNRVRGATLSEHGRADAIDVRLFKLADGRAFTLTDMTVDKAWRETMKATACARFSTVLGPGSDGNHEEHIHLDLAERRNNYKLCEWDVRVPPPPPENPIATDPLQLNWIMVQATASTCRDRTSRAIRRAFAPRNSVLHRPGVKTSFSEPASPYSRRPQARS